MTAKDIVAYESSVSAPIILGRIEDCPPDFINTPHRHEFYGILWFETGGSEHIIDFKSFPIKKDSIFFLAPGRVHQIQPINKKGKIFVFSQNFMSCITYPHEDGFFNLFYALDSAPFILPIKEELNRLTSLCKLLQFEYNNKTQDFAILQTYFRAFLLCIQRIKTQRKKQFSPQSDKRLTELFKLIENHYKTEKTVSFYAKHLALTPKRLNEITKAQFAKTVTQLIHKRLLLEAKREIYFGERMIKEIAYILGFKDPAYFSRFFKRYTTITPEQFKQKMFK